MHRDRTEAGRRRDRAGRPPRTHYLMYRQIHDSGEAQGRRGRCRPLRLRPGGRRDPLHPARAGRPPGARGRGPGPGAGRRLRLGRPGHAPPAEVAEYLGLRPAWVDSTAVGGSTWEVMAAHAADAIAAGHARAVLLVYGSTARADIKAGRRTGDLSFGARGPLQFEVPYGHTLIAKYAMAARRHMHQYGTTLEQLASVAVQARANAALNPEAMFRAPITVDDVLSGPMIADPFTKLHCCLRSDGGAAVLLVAEEYVRDCRTAPVWILGTGEHVSHTTMSEWADFTVSPAAVSGRLAFERAGCGRTRSTWPRSTTPSPT